MEAETQFGAWRLQVRFRRIMKIAVLKQITIIIVTFFLVEIREKMRLSLLKTLTDSRSFPTTPALQKDALQAFT